MNTDNFTPFDKEVTEELYIGNDENIQITFTNDDGLFGFFGNFEIDIYNFSPEEYDALKNITRLLNNSLEIMESKMNE